jgi:hypothetical protein
MKPISGKVEFFKPKKRFLSGSMLQQLQSAGVAEPWLKQLQGGSLPKPTEWCNLQCRPVSRAHRGAAGS